MDLARMSAAHEVLAEFRFDPAELHRGYAGRTLRIDVGRRDFRIDPVTRQMKDLWVGGKGFDLWLMFQEISAATRWDSPENPICFSSGPLGGVTSFPGAGKTIVTSVSPATGSIMDCNVGGWFGPYLKFTGFDALVITGRSDREVIVFIDGVDHRITIEAAPLESIDSHVVAEELTLLYAEDDADRRNLAVVSSGTAAAHSRMGVLNFSFWDWRRNVARLKQAGRGGIGTVFRHKGLKALVLRRRGVNPAWTITGSPASRRVQPPPQPSSGCRQEEDAAVAAVIGRHGSDPQRVVEMMLDLQRERRCISREAIEIISRATGTPRAWIYHVATFHDAFSLVPRGETSVEVCLGNACRAAGAETILQALQDRLGVTDGGTTADGRYTLRGVPCLGACSLAPAVRRGGHLFGGIREKDLAGLLDGSLAPAEGEAAAACMEGCGNALRHRGRVDPGRIETALGRGVFEGARRALSGRPEAVIDALAASELRGHGGGGFPAADKWTACRRAAAERGLSPVVICNANTDAAILESDPFSVLEGMLIAGWAVGATEGILYVRADNAAALVCASRALEQARDRRLLGQDVMGTGHAFDVTVRRAAGGFVAGEATAAVSSLGGRHAEPFPRWIRLAEQGLGGRPTLVSNVETLVNVPLVLTRGPSWFREHQGKLLTLGGAVCRAGLVEVPLGTSLREVVERYGGGVPAGEELKGLHIGGPSGGFLPAAELDLPLSFDALAAAGQILGNGVIIAQGRRTCIADTARDLTRFLAAESCGKCTPCREGLPILAGILERLCAGSGSEGDLEVLDEVSAALAETSLCGFGTTAANPVRTALRYYRDELEAHRHGRCPGGVCRALITYRINDRCTGCTLCAKKCPEEAITGEKKELHVIDVERCTRCGLCFEVCRFDAVEVS